MKIEDFIDPNNKDHVVAYKHLMEHGVWPEGFLSDITCFSPTWQFGVAFKFAKAYVNKFIENIND